jgi:glutathione S-transferase
LTALTPGPFLLGETFTAADVALGGTLSMAMFNKRLPERAVFVAYNKRLEGRPAYQRASQTTWPPHLYKPP